MGPRRPLTVAVGLVLALLLGLLAPLAGPSPAGAQTAVPDDAILAGDGGTFITTLAPTEHRFPHGTASRRAISRDCGHSVELPGNRSFWLFCDTVVYDDISGSPPDLDARVAFVPSGTGALAPIRTDPTPTQPISLREADHPAYPTAFIRSSGTYGAQDRPIECVGGYETVAWTKSIVTLPGTSTVLAFYQDHCPDIASGFAEYDVGIAEMALPEVAAGDAETGSASLKVTAQHDSVLVNPNPGSSRRWGYTQGAVVDGAYLYLYQAQPLSMDCSVSPCRIGQNGKVTVARVPWANGEYLDASRYRYYTGGGSDPWSSNPASAVQVIPDNGWPSGDGLSVKWYPEIDRYVMSHADSAFGTTHGLSLRTSHTPYGPWSAPIDVVPETASAPGHPEKRCASPVRCRTYLLHPELTGSTKLWFSYVREGDLATADGTEITIEGGGGMTVRLGSVPLASLPAPPAGSTALPGAPSGVTATAGDRQATVSWTAPSTGGTPVLGYRVTPYAGGTPRDPIAVTGSATTLDVRGLANGTAHTFEVRAVTAAGVGPASSRSTAVTPRGAPGAPTGIEVVEGDEEVTLSWTAPANWGGSAITGYRVTPWVDGRPQEPRILQQTSTSKVIGSLLNGVHYTFTVQAVNALGTSTHSAPSRVATPRGGPAAPTAVAGVAGDGEVVLSWTAPPSNGGAAISGYRVTPYVGGIPLPPRELSSPVTTKDIGLLTNGIPYTFTVAAVNEAGIGFESAMSAPVTPRAPQAGAPTGVTATPGAGSATVSWTAPTSTGGSPITGYRVTPWIGPAAQQSQVFTSTARTQVLTGLENGSYYRFTVKALTANGYGPSSEISDAVMPRTTPGAPTAITVEPGDGMAILHFVPPADNGGAPVTGYRITPYVGSTARPSFDTSYGTTQWAQGLTNGTTYTFTIRALNAAGAGPASARSAPVTPRTLAAAPGAVTATAGDGKAMLTWSAPSWDGGSPVVGYRVTPWLGGQPQEARTFDSALTAQTVTGLTNGATYRFTVRAVTSAGAGASTDFSGPVTPQPGLDPPDPAAHAPFPSWDALVRDVYVELLGRQPTASERTTWTGRLSQGQSTPGGLVQALRASSDHVTYVDPVARLYRAYLLRVPDMPGLQFWITQRRAGRSLYWISESFARSREFTSRYGALSNAQFMDLIYRQVLERPPEPTGYQFWLDELNSGRRSRGKVMVGFSEASEYKRRYSPMVDASVAHIYLLGRSPSSNEVERWVDRQKAGTPAAVLVDELMDSGEYMARNA